MKKLGVFIALSLLCSLASTADARNDNGRYGPTKIGALHAEAEAEGTGTATVLKDRAQVSKVPWVGSWWAYRSNGLANCWQTLGSECYQQDDNGSPADKLDRFLGIEANIDRTGLETYLSQVGSIDPLAIEKRDLIQTLNRWLSQNPGGDWRATDDGIRYLEVLGEIETAEEALPTIDVDTVTEFEVLEHGNGVQGVEGWWGHCNAWAAAAIMDPEPRRTTTVNGIEFTAADVKAYLTEAWMEHRSSFFGGRAYEDPYDANNDGETNWEDAPANYRDLTPAAFHIFVADQLGNKDKSFVIDRYTGSQVWNQPMRGYQTKMEQLSEDEGEDVAITQITYGYDGKGKINERGTKKVVRVLVTTTIHWITDGLPHDALLVENIGDLDDEDDFSSSFTLRSRYEDQVEIRTLTYELWLDGPLADRNSRIVGAGKWQHGSMIGNQNHPDFAWQPQAQGPSRRDYENPYIAYSRVVADILPGTLRVVNPSPTTPTPSELSFTATVGEDIPDDDKTGVRSIIAVTPVAEITSLTVTPNITHTYRADLELLLRKGRRWKKIKRRGDGGSADDLTAPIDVPHFIGDTTDGEWTLVVKDLWAQDAGVLNDWKIEFNQ